MCSSVPSVELMGCICVTFTDPNDADLAFVQFLKSHSCYDLIPSSSKLVIFDTHLTVMVFPPLLGIS